MVTVRISSALIIIQYSTQADIYTIIHDGKQTAISDNEQLQLTDTDESLLWHDVKDDRYAFDKLHFDVAPRSNDIVTRTEDSLVKSALFDFFAQYQQTDSCTQLQDIQFPTSLFYQLASTTWTILRGSIRGRQSP